MTILKSSMTALVPCFRGGAIVLVSLHGPPRTTFPCAFRVNNVGALDAKLSLVRRSEDRLAHVVHLQRKRAPFAVHRHRTAACRRAHFAGGLANVPVILATRLTGAAVRFLARLQPQLQLGALSFFAQNASTRAAWSRSPPPRLGRSSRREHALTHHQSSSGGKSSASDASSTRSLDLASGIARARRRSCPLRRSVADQHRVQTSSILVTRALEPLPRLRLSQLRSCGVVPATTTSLGTLRTQFAADLAFHPIFTGNAAEAGVKH